jgi:hypothetical protein
MNLQENCSSKIRKKVKGSLNTVSRQKRKKRELASRPRESDSELIPKFSLQRACDSSTITRGIETLVDDELIPGIARNKTYPPTIQPVTLLMQDGDGRSPLAIYACLVFFLALEKPQKLDQTAGNSFSTGLYFAFEDNSKP